MIAHAHARGLAVPETAFVIAFVLLLLNATVQLAQLNFMQLAADGASFVASHDTAASKAVPTNADLAAAKTAAAGAFKTVAISGAIGATQKTFETDINQNVPGFSVLGTSPTVAIQSRQIEATAGGTASTTPASDCVLSKTDIGSSTSKTLGGPVGMLNGPMLLGVGNSGVANDLGLNVTGLASRQALLDATGNAFQQLGQAVSTVNTALGLTAGSGPLGALTGTLTGPLGNAIAAEVKLAANGTLGASLTLAAFDAQINTSIQTQLGVAAPPGLGTILGTVVDPVLTPIFNALTALNADEIALAKIDALATTTCPVIP